MYRSLGLIVRIHEVLTKRIHQNSVTAVKVSGSLSVSSSIYTENLCDSKSILKETGESHYDAVIGAAPMRRFELVCDSTLAGPFVAYIVPTISTISELQSTR